MQSRVQDKQHEQCLMAANAIGQWTELLDSMYQTPMGALIQTFPNNKYIKLVCSQEPDPGPLLSILFLLLPSRNTLLITLSNKLGRDQA